MLGSGSARAVLLVTVLLGLAWAENIRDKKEADSERLLRLIKSAAKERQSHEKPVHQTWKKSQQTRGSNTYQVSVYTGDRSFAGTDADVFIILYGDSGNTGTIELEDDSWFNSMFEEGDVDDFTISADVGTLTKIRIGHDDSGFGSGWYLEKVVISCSETGQTWEFLCNRWLDDGEDDGAIERDLYPLVTADNGDPVCGVPDIQPKGDNRVVGGVDATPHSWPWQILLISSVGRCGGSIIAKRWVLTASHCVDGASASSATVTVGEHDRGSSDGEYDIGVKQIIMHEGYSSDTLNNDVALLELDEDVPFSSIVKPVCLPSIDVAAGTTCTVTGWGDTKGTADDDILQQLSMPVISNSECQSYFGGYIIDSTICTDAGAGAGSCQGDSGGPLVCPTGDAYSLHGVVSFGAEGCVTAPSAYARTSKFVSWIQSKTGNAAQVK